VFGSATATTEALPATATFTIVAGRGPTPGTVDPGFLGDNEALQISLVPGGMMHFEAFTAMFDDTLTGVGDDFTLSDASQITINSIPTDGSAFTIGCAGAGGTCNTAFGTILSITTTDGPLTGAEPPYYMPPVTARQVVIRCAQIGLEEITVPDAASAFLAGSGATRIQATLIRSGFAPQMNAGLPMATTNVVAGHGVVGFTTPGAP
jgi:hypothetical protein